jgi:hypothetical protein
MSGGVETGRAILSATLFGNPVTFSATHVVAGPSSRTIPGRRSSLFGEPFFGKLWRETLVTLLSTTA